jgi:serine/threonine-protein kinase
MFLDEARILARIRHPNVVDVHELGHEEGELFLVMEYLEGESADGLLRRLATRGERLPHAIAAYLVAEAAAGLHAAHELGGARGAADELVHRDVSPQNIFVTYGGRVKVLDFGIALAADRITRTEAGQVKGKFEYMAPEQWEGEPLDRRTDIFALGVVLYELLTGHRLFKRNAQLATMRAICGADAPRPSSLDPSVPPEIDDVCLRALARDPDARYSSAADMRRALLRVTHGAAGEPAPEEVVERLMKRLFADRIEDKAVMLRRVREGSTVLSLPPADADPTVELPLSPADPVSTRINAPVSPPPSSRWRRLVASALLAGGVATCFAVAAPRVAGHAASPPQAQPATSSAEIAAVPSVSPPAAASAEPPPEPRSVPSAKPRVGGVATRRSAAPRPPHPAPSRSGFSVIPL